MGGYDFTLHMYATGEVTCDKTYDEIVELYNNGSYHLVMRLIGPVQNSDGTLGEATSYYEYKGSMNISESGGYMIFGCPYGLSLSGETLRISQQVIIWYKDDNQMNMYHAYFEQSSNGSKLTFYPSAPGSDNPE